MRRQSKHASQNFVFSPDARADTWYALALLLHQLLCAWIEQRNSNGAHSTVLLQSYVWAIKTQNNWYEYVRAPAPSTAVTNTLGYSTRNHKFKRLEPRFSHFGDEVGMEGDLGNYSVALSHSRECTKEPISALPSNEPMERSELEQNYAISNRKI